MMYARDLLRCTPGPELCEGCGREHQARERRVPCNFCRTLTDALDRTCQPCYDKMVDEALRTELLGEDADPPKFQPWG